MSVNSIVVAVLSADFASPTPSAVTTFADELTRTLKSVASGVPYTASLVVIVIIFVPAVAAVLETDGRTPSITIA